MPLTSHDQLLELLHGKQQQHRIRNFVSLRLQLVKPTKLILQSDPPIFSFARKERKRNILELIEIYGGQNLIVLSTYLGICITIGQK